MISARERSAWDAYFEQPDHWMHGVSPFERQLMTKMLRALPQGISSLLDVGCGAGHLCRLANEAGLAAFGLDRSGAALRVIQGCPRIQGDISQLPFPDGSIDIVVAQDILEHLPEEIHEGAWTEVFRVAKQWVMVVSPNREDLRYPQHRCQVCGMLFHENGHRRSVDLQSLCLQAAQHNAIPRTVFFGSENWPYYDEISAVMQHELTGWRPVWDLAVCPGCGHSERGLPTPGTPSLLEPVELGKNLEFQKDERYWRRNRASEIGVVFEKIPGAPCRSQGTTCRNDRVLNSERCLTVRTSSPLPGNGIEVSRVAWPRGLIACGSDLQAIARPINHAGFSYLYMEGQQWGDAERIAGRWARRMHPDRPGGHACFVLCGQEVFTNGLRVQYLDDLKGNASVEIYDQGTHRYLPIGSIARVGDGQWKEAVFPVPRALPNVWGYLFHLIAAPDTPSFAVSQIGSGHPDSLDRSTLHNQSGNEWRLTDIEYPNSLFRDGHMVALLSEGEDVQCESVSFETHQGPSLLGPVSFSWRAGTPLFLAAELFDASSGASTTIDTENLQHRMLLLAINGMQALSDSEIRAEIGQARQSVAALSQILSEIRAEMEQTRHSVADLNQLLLEMRAEQVRPRTTFLHNVRLRLLGEPIPVQPLAPAPPWKTWLPSPADQSSLKVLVLSHMFPHPDQPTSGPFIMEQVKALRRRGVDARVVVGRPFWMASFSPRRVLRGNRQYVKVHESTSWWTLDGVPVLYLPYRIVGPFLSHGWTYRSSVLRAIKRIRKVFPFDLVHAHTAYLDGGAGLAVSKRFHVPFVITEHTGPFSYLTKHPLVRSWTVRSLNRASRVLAVSEALRRQVVAHMNPERTAVTQVIPNGVDTGLFHPSAHREFRSGAPRLLFVGYFCAIKNLPVLVNAFSEVLSRIPGATLSFVGQGETQAQDDELRALVHSQGLEKAVIFRGYQPRAEVARIMREECDILVLSSDAETFGCVLTEALASGKPVVSTRCGGPEDIITDPKLGDLAPVGDAQALADAICKVASKLESYDPEGIRANTMDRFSYEVIAEKLEGMYRDLLAKVRR